MFSSVLLISSNFLDEVWLILFHENLFGNTQKNHCVLERVVKKTPQTIKKYKVNHLGPVLFWTPLTFILCTKTDEIFFRIYIFLKVSCRFRTT